MPLVQSDYNDGSRTMSICVLAGFNHVTEHRERMLHGGTFMCSRVNILGNTTKFRKISVKNVFY